MLHSYCLTGYSQYHQYRQEIKNQITLATKDQDLNYYIAVNEAVANAARYGLGGPLNTEIRIKLRVDDDSVQTEIQSDTVEFDFLSYRDKLRNLATDESLKGMDWHTYLSDADRGRGIWFMLAACDYGFAEKSGRVFLLHAPLPYQPQIVRSQISHLAARFFIMDRGLII